MKQKTKIAGILILVLILTLLFVLLPFLINGKYLTWIGIIKEKDGITQHATFLQYLTRTDWNFVNHFDFNIGLGADYFVSFIYYMILDPFNLFLLVFPFSDFLISYSLLIVLKFLACGIFMYIYLRHKKIEVKIAIPISALYMIGGYLLFSFLRHPNLSNGAIYLPLIILGIEQLFENKKPYLLIFSTFFCFISNFYIFYMVSIFVVLYTILYYFEVHSKFEWKSFFLQVGKVAFWYLIGILLASFMLLPLLSGFLNSARDDTKGFQWFSLTYYLNLLSKVIVPPLSVGHLSLGYYTPLSFNLVMLFCILPFYFFKTNKTYRICLTILFIGLIIPLFGYVFNGFNYVNNRWVFLFDFVLCVSLALSLKQVKEVQPSFKEKRTIKEKIVKVVQKPLMMPLLFVVTLVFGQVSMWFYQKEFDDGTVWLAQESIQEQYVAQLQKDNTFFRTDKIHQSVYTDNYSNTPIKNQYAGTYLYNTITNQKVYDFLKSLGMYNATQTLGITGLNQRKAIQTLLSVLYYIQDDEKTQLYGYQKTECDGVYQNEHYLPFGFLYSDKMSEEEFYQLPIQERQAALMRYLIVPSKENKIAYQNQTQEIQPSIQLEGNIVYDESLQQLIVNEDDAKIIFTFPAIDNAELYMNLQFTTQKAKKQDILIESNQMFYHQRVFKKGEQMYNDLKEFSYCLGYYTSDLLPQVTITFPKEGKYKIENLSFSTYSMNDFETAYQQLKDSTMTMTQFTKNKIEGTINVIQEQANLFFSIPYNQGWKVKIDGKECPLYQAQIGFMAVDIPQGEHQVELYYQTPYLKTGTIISGVVLTFVLGYFIYDQFLLKKLQKNKKKIIMK